MKTLILTFVLTIIFSISGCAKKDAQTAVDNFLADLSVCETHSMKQHTAEDESSDALYHIDSVPRILLAETLAYFCYEINGTEALDDGEYLVTVTVTALDTPAAQKLYDQNISAEQTSGKYADYTERELRDLTKKMLADAVERKELSAQKKTVDVTVKKYDSEYLAVIDDDFKAALLGTAEN